MEWAGDVDVAATRRESYARPGALPTVELGAPIRTDLARRDFTVNALAVPLRVRASCSIPTTARPT